MSLTFFPSMFFVFLHNTLLLTKSQQNNQNKINFLKIVTKSKRAGVTSPSYSSFSFKIAAILVLIRSIATTFEAPSGMMMSA